MTADELVRWRGERAGVRLLDVRTPGEYEARHIEGSWNVPLSELDRRAAEIRAAAELERMVVICRTGQRSRKAEALLRAAGIADVRVLEGGVDAWVAAGHPVREGRQRLSLERQVRIVAGGLAAAGGLLAMFVNPLYAAVPAMVGSGLVFAGLTDTCGLAMLLAKLPYNRGPAGVGSGRHCST